MKKFTVEECFEIEGTKFFIFSYGNKYGCFFEGREDFMSLGSIKGAKIEGLCAYQEITGKKLPNPEIR